jgi:hypothetical protein
MANGIVKALALTTKQKQKILHSSCATVLTNETRTTFHKTLASLAMLVVSLRHV